jgi:hypothetical protein
MRDATRISGGISSQAVAVLLTPYAPELRSLRLATRTFVLVWLRSRIPGHVGVIRPIKAGVNPGIAYAAESADPKKLLEAPANCIALSSCRANRI